jgi:prophage antirepressor-like protein
MIFINDKLNTNLTVIEDEEGGLFFDLYEVAKGLGYARPNKAVLDFVERNRLDLESVLTKDFDGSQAIEGLLHLFLIQSNTAKAKAYQLWVAFEVLPSVRRVGLKAIKQMEIIQQIKSSPNLTLEELESLASKELILETLDPAKYYRVLGFVAPSDVWGRRLHTMYDLLVSEKYLTPEGDLIRTDAAIHCPSYHNGYLPNGKWYAWRPEVLQGLLDRYEPPVELYEEVETVTVCKQKSTDLDLL